MIKKSKREEVMLHHFFTLTSTASTTTYRYDLRGTACKKKAVSPPPYTNAPKDTSVNRPDRVGLHVNRGFLLSRGKIHSPRLGQIAYIGANDSHHAEAIGVILSRIGVGIRRVVLGHVYGQYRSRSGGVYISCLQCEGIPLLL